MGIFDPSDTFPQEKADYVEAHGVTRTLSEIIGDPAITDMNSMCHYLALKEEHPEDAKKFLSSMLTYKIARDEAVFSKGIHYFYWLDIKGLGGQEAVTTAEQWLQARRALNEPEADKLLTKLGEQLADSVTAKLAQEKAKTAVEEIREKKCLVIGSNEVSPDTAVAHGVQLAAALAPAEFLRRS